MAYSAKRRFPRLQNREGVKIQSSRGVEYGTVEDISAMGVGVFADNEFPLGSILDLEFNFRSAERQLPMGCRGRVIRCQKTASGYQLGVAFLQREALLEAELQKAVDQSFGPF